DSVVRYNGTNGVFSDVFIPSGSGGLDRPYGLTFGPDSRLYVCSAGNNKVLRYDGTTGAFLGTFIDLGPGFVGTAKYVVFTPQVYTLSIAPSPSGIVLSWPTTPTNLVLETCQTLTTTNHWLTVTNQPTTVGNEFVLTNPVTGGQSFFRLQKE